MKHIQKGNAPAFFTDFLKKEKPKEWADTAPIRSQLREYILEHEQQGCCAYTEIRISEDKACHIDHYHTRNLFPDETFNYVICWFHVMLKIMGPNTKTNR